MDPRMIISTEDLSGTYLPLLPHPSTLSESFVTPPKVGQATPPESLKQELNHSHAPVSRQPHFLSKQAALPVHAFYRLKDITLTYTRAVEIGELPSQIEDLALVPKRQ
jgi:hypothetical protein